MESNKGQFAKVLRELELSTRCVRWALDGISEYGHPPIHGTSWDGYWFDGDGKCVDVHAIDKSMCMCCECAFRYGNEDDDDSWMDFMPDHVYHYNTVVTSEKTDYYIRKEREGEENMCLPAEGRIVIPGEYFPMKDDDDAEKYCSEERDILIYDEDHDHGTDTG